MKNPTNITLDIYNACRTNTGRAAKSDGHYDLKKLMKISGAKDLDFLAEELQWCAENHEDEFAVKAIQNLAEALLSAYEIQSKSYK